MALTAPWHKVKLTRGADSGEAEKEAATLQRTVRAFWEFKRTLQWLCGRSSVVTMLGKGEDGLT